MVIGLLLHQVHDFRLHLLFGLGQIVLDIQESFLSRLRQLVPNIHQIRLVYLFQLLLEELLVELQDLLRQHHVSFLYLLKELLQRRLVQLLQEVYLLNSCFLVLIHFSLNVLQVLMHLLLHFLVDALVHRRLFPHAILVYHCFPGTHTVVGQGCSLR